MACFRRILGAGDSKKARQKKMGDKPLRLMTYMSPDMPLVLFELFRDFLEEQLGTRALLTTESRWMGPPDDRPDPFTVDEADVVFLSSTSFLEQKDKKNKFVELCKVAPLHINPRMADEPVCFSEVVVHKAKIDQHLHRDIEGLRGSRWAYSNRQSMTGSMAMLSELKKRGYNANFFASTHESGSQLKSIQMVLSGIVDVASVNSVVLNYYRLEHPDRAQHLAVIKTIGPLPIYSIAFNTRLPAEKKKAVTQALLSVGQGRNYKWAGQFMTLGVKGFVAIDEIRFRLETDLVESVQEMTMAPAYY